MLSVGKRLEPDAAVTTPHSLASDEMTRVGLDFVTILNEIEKLSGGGTAE